MNVVYKDICKARKKVVKMDGICTWRNMKRVQECAWKTSLKFRLSNQK